MQPNLNQRYLVFIHGVGGAKPENAWLRPLSDVMALTGCHRPEDGGVKPITVTYRDAILNPGISDLPEETWKRPKDIAADFAEFQVARARAERVAAVWRHAPATVHFGRIGIQPAEKVAGLVEVAAKRLRAEAREYRTNDAARASVLDAVLRQLPQEGHAVVVAHSLGTVVALDLARRLPPGLTIDRLITVGSPLALGNFWPFVRTVGSGFPYDRIKSWINIFDNLDLVTSGRGVEDRFPDAVDIDVNVGSYASIVGNHASEAYLSLPVVGALVGEALESRDSVALPAQQPGAAWNLYLLGAAYATQVAATCSTKKHAWRRNFNAARRASVEKLLQSIAEREDLLSVPECRPLPTGSDLMDHAAARVRGMWSDDELLPFAVALLMSSPVKPFEISVDGDHAEMALAAVMDRVRVGGSNIADQVFAKEVAASLEEATKDLADSSWKAYLLLGGAAVLVATGVGFWAAMPAGVAGAAFLTSTLAAFGPGGMVGGMVTIAAASGAGSALLGAGVTHQADKSETSLDRFTEALAGLSRDQLRSTAVGMLAVLYAQERLGLDSTAARSRGLFSRALAHIANEEELHVGLRSKAAKDWAVKRALVEETMKIIDRRFPDPIRDLVERALETATGPLIVEPSWVGSLAVPDAPEMPALGTGDHEDDQA